MTRMERRRRGRPRHPDMLTPAEWRVLEALREGGTNAEIGARLGITADGVKFHVSNMLSKLGVRNRRELAAWHPEPRRRRLRALFDVPAGLAAVAEPVALVGAGAAAVAGVTVSAIAVVAVVAVVLVGVGGNGEPAAVVQPRAAATSTAIPTPAPTPTAMATPAPTSTPTPMPAVTTPTPSPTVSPSPEPDRTPTPTPEPEQAPTHTASATPGGAPKDEAVMNYNRLDTTGRATAPGRYAFLTTADDATSAVANIQISSPEVVELRIHPLDGRGLSQAETLDAVGAGDVVDYRVSPYCAERFRVTGAESTAVPRSFGVKSMGFYGGSCSGDWEGVTIGLREVSFVWHVRDGTPGPDGVRFLIDGVPAGPGTYRIHREASCAIDVPVGTQVLLLGWFDGTPDADAEGPDNWITLQDVASGSLFFIDPETCREIGRDTTTPNADALFDQMAASLRSVPAPVR